MELIRTIREKHQTARQENLQKDAEQIITLSDFDDNIYIAYNGTPLIAIDKDWTQKDILKQLSIVRQNYINAKSKNWFKAAML